MTSLYAALDEPNADVDLILGQLADWLLDHGETEHHEWVRERDRFGECAYCGCRRATKLQEPMTMYYDDEDNYVGQLCYLCHVEYVECWTERWEEYYSMVY